ncbi:peptidyl-prolyl cis-trans isomerase [Erythrobacter sp. JK5]|uniref:peptidylprolyl isomerase n=1 Tax=Erythrobacter sp. JK5 TaxID=2829500 RepID=UPI001BA4B68E|nr:peptidyl-prolyl cis-trans isomerase [Erythrobacter sp. JK5]QUL37684.1 peptidyl-prolyl cis-trans isomerase [Erythrobacter sp. JK5]
MTLPGWTREPLVHFLVGGALLFVLFAWTGGNAVDPSSRLIAVDRAQQAQLALQFERTMSRPPTDAEIDAAIAQFVRDEVLYREALRLGLDRGDAVVRRRLVAKMDMTASAAAETAVPEEPTLRAYFKENRARYSGATSVSFDQLYFKSEAAARRALATGVVAGDPISLPARMEAAAPGEIEARFGETFTRALAGIAANGEWAGPIRSGFGWHIARVSAREGVEPDFETLAPRIANDWRSAQIAERKRRAYQVLREGYRVEIDR